MRFYQYMETKAVPGILIMMKPIRLAFQLLVLPGALCSWEAVAGTLDQQYLPSGGDGLIVARSQTVAQTFEVGLSGLLDRVDISLARNAVLPAEGLILEIRSTLPDGSPMSSVLASEPISAADVSIGYQFLSIDFSQSGLLVSGGDTLALVLRSNAEVQGSGIDPFAWSAETPGGYTRGAVFTDQGSGFLSASGWDVGFQTYVDTTVVPEPSAIAILLVGAGALIYRRHCDGK